MWIKLAYIFGHHDLCLAMSFQKCAHMDGKVSPDGARKRSSRVGLTKHNTTSLNCVQPLPNLSDSKIKNTFNSTGCLTIAQTGPLAM